MFEDRMVGRDIRFIPLSVSCENSNRISPIGLVLPLCDEILTFNMCGILNVWKPIEVGFKVGRVDRIKT
ncbi:hypothetical protein D3C86_1382110 [compost metagenome]